MQRLLQSPLFWFNVVVMIVNALMPRNNQLSNYVVAVTVIAGINIALTIVEFWRDSETRK